MSYGEVSSLGRQVDGNNACTRAKKPKALAKKGANPLKSKHKETKGVSVAPNFSSVVPISHHVDAVLPDPNQAAVSQPPFDVQVTPPLVTLSFRSATAQYLAMARMEAFYESSSSSRRYMTLVEASKEKLCRNYEAFNLPVSSVRDWMRAMKETEAMRAESASGWRYWVNDGESQVLEQLFELEAIEDDEGDLQRVADEDGLIDGGPRSSSLSSRGERDDVRRSPVPSLQDTMRSLTVAGKVPETNTTQDTSAGRSRGPVTYIISCLASQKHKALRHERMHALYHLCPDYRSVVARCYAQLSRRALKAVEIELQLRGYGVRVWADEWQAYIADGETDIGGGVAKRENEALRKEVVQAAQKTCKRAGLELSFQ